MDLAVSTKILACTSARSISRIEQIQPLWSNYGTLSRVYLEGSSLYPSVIVKHIKIPVQNVHPKGFHGSVSKQRKIKSYEVETQWYQKYNHLIASSETSPTPKCIEAFHAGNELFLLLEDLDTRGFTKKLFHTSWNEVCVVLRWLAQFHAQFMNHIPNGLWECGTYWHLETRPEELENILGSPLHTMAPFIDAKLKHSSFQTFVHGDAKLANFCFSADHTRAAAVDFQYVGKGCGMKDVAYFISSCMNEEECAIYESQILDCYFSELRKALTLSNIDPALLEEEWRALYHVSWADFQRFILGWSPQHKKNNTYSQRITDNVIEEITESLLYVAQTACIKAGTYIKEQWKTTHQTSSKGLNSEAADIVTQIDIQAQDHIIQELNESIKEYNLGILAEEGEHNNSRFDKHAFWTIDPLDGTLFYTAQKEGFAVSIALVTYSGNPIMGIVYDPVTETLYHAVNDQGFFINNKRYSYPTVLKMEKTCTLYADQSLKKQPNFKRLSSRFHIRYTGGAVMNTIHVITGERSLYVKPPKETLGGCAIWDIAAVSLFLKEAHGRACLWDGSKILLNRKESIYFNDVGLFFSSPDINATELMNIVRGLL